MAGWGRCRMSAACILSCTMATYAGDISDNSTGSDGDGCCCWLTLPLLLLSSEEPIAAVAEINSTARMIDWWSFLIWSNCDQVPALIQDARPLSNVTLPAPELLPGNPAWPLQLLPELLRSWKTQCVKRSNSQLMINWPDSLVAEHIGSELCLSLG